MGEESSNYREAENLLTRLESAVKDGKYKGAEVLLITDNIVFEGTYYKGYSRSPKLCDLALRLHKAALFGGVILHVIHVAGTRMKESGIDGLSRGDMLDGMLKGEEPLKFLPIN